MSEKSQTDSGTKRKCDCCGKLFYIFDINLYPRQIIDSRKTFSKNFYYCDDCYYEICHD